MTDIHGEFSAASVVALARQSASVPSTVAGASAGLARPVAAVLAGLAAVLAAEVLLVLIATRGHFVYALEAAYTHRDWWWFVCIIIQPLIRFEAAGMLVADVLTFVAFRGRETGASRDSNEGRRSSRRLAALQSPPSLVHSHIYRTSDPCGYPSSGDPIKFPGTHRRISASTPAKAMSELR